jgi:hypothetical protein
VICGGHNATINGGKYGVIIGGGYSRISGGYYNVIMAAGGSAPSIRNEITSGSGNTILCGRTNLITAGAENVICGSYNTIVNGQNNTLIGSYNTISSIKSGCTLIGDNNINQNIPTNDNEFRARFENGYKLFTDAAMTTGVEALAGAAAWSSISARDSKAEIEVANYAAILEKLTTRVPISTYKYKAAAAAADRYIGPIADDWWNAFEFGPSASARTHIDTITPAGVALACIHAVNARIEALEIIVAKQSALIGELIAAVEIQKK